MYTKCPEMGRWPEGGERPSRDPHYSLPTLQPICLVGLEFFDLVSNGGTIEVWQVSIAMNSTNIEWTKITGRVSLNLASKMVKKSNAIPVSDYYLEGMHQSNKRK